MVLQSLRQPGVHLADVVLQQGQVAVVMGEPGFDSGDVGGQPLAVRDGKETVLPAVQEQDWNGDIGQLEPPRAEPVIDVIPQSPRPARSALMQVIVMARIS